MAVYPYGPIKPRIRFSRTELRHILIAMAVLILAFTLWLGGGLRGVITVERYLASAILAAIAVPTGFLLHELGHKVVAQRYGFPAEFRAYTFGLFIALFTALLGIIFAAPGAVVVGGVAGRREYGRISAAGPAVNLAIGTPFLIVWLVLFFGMTNVPIAGVTSLLVVTFGVALINFILGTFNMIPLGPLDGAKVLRWDPRIYFLLLVALAGPTIFLFLQLFSGFSL